MKNRSFFYTILKYSLVMMILPLLTTFLLYFWAENMMREHIQESSNKSLNQFFTLVDRDIADFRDACIALGDNRECQKFASYGKTDPQRMGFQAQVVKQTLSQQFTSKLSEILIYYPYTDRVVSNITGSLLADEFFQSYYADAENYRECFAEFLECDSKQPVLVRIDVNDQENLLCIAMRKKYIGDPQQDYIVALVINEDYLLEILQQNHLKSNGALMIFDREQKLLVSSDMASHYQMDGYDGTDAQYSLETDKGTYIMQIMPSESVAGYYAYATDSAEFWQELSALRICCITIVVLCVLVNLVVAFCGTQRIFKPLKSVVKRIEKDGHSSYNQLEHSEIEFIERILEISAEKKRENNKSMQNDFTWKRDHFLISVLQGDKVAQKSNLDKYGIPVHSNRYMVALIFVQKKNDIDAEMLRFVLKNVFEEIANSEGWGTLVDQGHNRFALLMNLAEGASAERRLNDLKRIQSYISQQLELKFVIASGNECRGLENIHDSYEEANLAMRYQYLLTDSGLIRYDDIKDRDFSYFPHLESALSRKIINYIEDQTEKIPEDQFVAEIIDMCGINSDASMDSIECFKYEMLSAINKVYLISGDTEDQKKSLASLMTQPNWDLFRNELVEILKRLRHMENCSNKQDKICMHCMRYIQENFRDPNLSIMALGDKFKMSPYYVSQLFKNRYGVSIPDYLTKLRIENAKADLISSTKSVKDIAEENGFVNSNVLIRSFKKYEGVTPGEYRRNKA